MARVSSRWLAGFCVALGGCGAVNDSLPEPPKAVKTEPLFGANTSPFPSTGVDAADAPFGSVGWLRIPLNICTSRCSDGTPPYMTDAGLRCDASTLFTSCQNFQGDCSGTLIQRNRVLTAGHCICDLFRSGGGWPETTLTGPITFALPTHWESARVTPNPAATLNALAINVVTPTPADVSRRQHRSLRRRGEQLRSAGCEPGHRGTNPRTHRHRV